MKFSAPLLAIISLASASPVDMSPYKPESNVDAAFAPFVEEYGCPNHSRANLQGATSILAVKQNLLPPDGNKAWWHLIEGANVVSEDSKTKTINAKIVIQTTYTPGNCSQAHGNAAFTVAKGADGIPNWTAHTGNLLVYNLTVNTIQTPTDEACTAT
ncbi:hypothetical protein PG994_012924 [Apiospora phragmitis]|uniref:Uncharacterized protein n=1 Tax=Apiospora phragmitis TaxID=2905665 RepID=A0ABR1T8V6_9PEZI